MIRATTTVSALVSITARKNVHNNIRLLSSVASSPNNNIVPGNVALINETSHNDIDNIIRTETNDSKKTTITEIQQPQDSKRLQSRLSKTGQPFIQNAYRGRPSHSQSQHLQPNRQSQSHQQSQQGGRENQQSQQYNPSQYQQQQRLRRNNNSNTNYNNDNSSNNNINNNNQRSIKQRHHRHHNNNSNSNNNNPNYDYNNDDGVERLRNAFLRTMNNNGSSPPSRASTSGGSGSLLTPSISASTSSSSSSTNNVNNSNGRLSELLERAERRVNAVRNDRRGRGNPSTGRGGYGGRGNGGGRGGKYNNTTSNNNRINNREGATNNGRGIIGRMPNFGAGRGGTNNSTKDISFRDGERFPDRSVITTTDSNITANTVKNDGTTTTSTHKKYNNHQNNNHGRAGTSQIIVRDAEVKSLRSRIFGDGPNANNTHDDNNSSLKASQEDDKRVILPHRPLNISTLSSLLRVKIPTIEKALVALTGPQQKEEEYAAKIDTDVAELICLELGFDPQREERRSRNGRRQNWDMLEGAERRVMRGNDENDASEMLVSEEEEAYYATLSRRPPVVCIMGHVDHGKTTLMDALRKLGDGITTTNNTALGKGATGGKKNNKKKKKNKKSSTNNTMTGNNGTSKPVAGTEAGGITQAVSAFSVPLPGAESLLDDYDVTTTNNIASVTILDTPGHSAFRTMRQSGANGADVVVLVIAADDGVSEQTLEIIKTCQTIASAKPGSISMVVALTKIDKVIGEQKCADDDDIGHKNAVLLECRSKIENELMSHGIYVEGTSPSGQSHPYTPLGEVQMIPISSITGEGLDNLVEGLVLQSEIMDLRADDNARAEGIVIDARVS